MHFQLTTKELLEKMYKLSSATEDTTRLDLKPKELTFANILENGYTMLDINNSLANNEDNSGRTGLLPGYKPFEPCDMNSLSLELSLLETPEKEKEQQTAKKQT